MILENGMIKKSPAGDYREAPFLPCKSEGPGFTEYILEEFTLVEIIGIPGVMDALIKAKLDDYETWLREE